MFPQTDIDNCASIVDIVIQMVGSRGRVGERRHHEAVYICSDYFAAEQVEIKIVLWWQYVRIHITIYRGKSLTSSYPEFAMSI
jgi:hypothetical protein